MDIDDLATILAGTMGRAWSLATTDLQGSLPSWLSCRPHALASCIGALLALFPQESLPLIKVDSLVAKAMDSLPADAWWLYGIWDRPLGQVCLALI